MKISETEVDNSYWLTLLLTVIEQRKTKKGDPYVRLTLSDGKTEAVANLFNNTTREDLEERGIKEDSPVDIKLRVSLYNDQKNYTVDAISPATLTSEELALLIKMPPKKPEELFINICRKVKSSSSRQYDMTNMRVPDDDYSLTALTMRLLLENSKAIIMSSAAKAMHHNIYGGLVYHTSRMVDMAEASSNVYPGLNKELLICGTALHDIGKIKELTTGISGSASYTVDGRLFGHSLIGIEMIDREVMRADAMAGRETYDREEVKLLKHLIASHHGILEWGAIAVPAIPEAMVLHNIDMIDSRMYMYEENLSNIEPGKLSDPVFGIAGEGKATVYKPN
ncbi:MAG: HD domain-containing protein [Saccharofermentans sp.]|nr:HD domain-containing protein [Saccharofermentans sp.]